MLKLTTDVWGEAALKQPNGPSYEFFVPLLPPLRYCDAPFRHYPITLSAPGAPVKARFVSNGSAINALARQPNWRGETGTPVTFRVTRSLELFGDDLSRLDGPKYEQGYLPIVQLKYRAEEYPEGQFVFGQEAFASVDPAFARDGVVFVRFTVADGVSGRKGKIEAQIETTPAMKVVGEAVHGERGAVVAFEKDKWRYVPGRATLVAEMEPGQSAVLAVYTNPAKSPAPVTAEVYDAQRKQCVDTWNRLLGQGMHVSTPEKVVNDAWRATTIGNFMLLSDDQMNYSQGNQYAKLYIAEGGDANRTMALWNFPQTAKTTMTPLFVYTREPLKYHQAALKLQMLSHVYFLTRDADFVRSLRVISEDGRKPGWQTELDLLLTGRESESGLFPPEWYAGDIEDKVYSLNSNANGWRGLRDFAVVLDEIGEKDLADRAKASAEEFRRHVLAAIEKSIDRSVDPPFIPLALFGKEKPYVPLMSARLASYWNIMTKYVLTSGVFPIDHEFADYLIDYTRRQGGLCMGLNRNFVYLNTWWIDQPGINDLYGMRYALALLERDEPEHALVSFYGKLAHGFTRDTFIDGEGASIVPMYGDGRQTYLPPNSAGNASYLQQLRYLLIQDYDTTDDGTPDTLRLAFATPRRWLADGEEIKVERAPTTFGPLNMVIRSQLAKDEVTADLDLPTGAPAKTLLRLRLPDGYTVASATANGQEVAVAQPEQGATLDLTGSRGKVEVRAKVQKSDQPANTAAAGAAAR